MSFYHSQPGRRTNEDVFFEYHSQLLTWAAQITRNDRAESEDLVQDFYLTVLRISRTLDGMEQLEGYLFRVLRNLYYARMRRARREPIDSLSIVDYDSVEQGLVAADRRELLFIRSHLEQICLYACQRKSTNRAAGILIMRFFLGYYPSELMKVVQIPRYVVDQALHVARNEARMHLDRPGAIVSISPAKSPSISVSKRSAGNDSHDIFLKLRETIFRASEGEHFDRAVLEQRYAGGETPSPLSAQQLAHLVSCPTCLDQVNTILHLPLLAERSPEYGLDRDGGSGPQAGIGENIASQTRTKRSDSKKGPSLRKLERRARDVYEHRPDSLEIVVDGDIRSSQKVTAEINEFCLKLARKEEPSFIEVISEQGFRLAFLLVEAPVSVDMLQQVESVSLSDGRSLVLTLSFAAEDPTVHVLYHDPVVAEESAAKPMTGSASTDLVRLSTESPTKTIVLVPANRTLRGITRVITFLSKNFKRFFVDMMNPMLATSLVCGVAAVVLLVLSLRTASMMTPRELLQRATVAENATAQSGASGVVVQSVRIQTPLRKVERTLYRDIQHKRSLKNKTLSHQDASLRTELENSGIPWNDPLSADSFRDWHDGVTVLRDIVKRPEKGLLTLTTTVSTGRIASESLTVREADFRPIKRTVELRDAGTIEVAELNYSVLPWSSVNPDIFEPLTAVPEAEGRHLHTSLLPHLPHAVTPGELDLAELSARLVLNRLGFDANSRIEITRNLDGVHVRGLVDTEMQKSQLQAQLRLIPNVVPSILTVQEMENDANSGSSITSIRQSSDVAAAPSALEMYFNEHHLDQQEFSSTTQDFLEGSFAVKWETEQLSTLLQRFSTDTTLSTPARTALAELLVQHKTALLAALAREERALMRAQLTVPPSSSVASSNDLTESLRKDAGENFALCIELTSDSKNAPRPAQIIAPQLAKSIAELRATALQISPTALSLSSSPGNAGLASKND